MPALELDVRMSNRKNGISFAIQIVSQRLRGSRAAFRASNGFVFTSLSCPAIGVGYNSEGGSGSQLRGLLYLRGSTCNADDYTLYTRSVGYVESLKAAVIEYNIHKEGI